MSKLNFLNAWKEGAKGFFAPRSAQGVMNGHKVALATAGACGASDEKPSACGAGDEKPSACGAGDEAKSIMMATAACGSSCGAGDEAKEEEKKPSACGSACGAGDEK